jgi:hypothetical protein
MAQLVKCPCVNREDMGSNPARNVGFVPVHVMKFPIMVMGASFFF